MNKYNMEELLNCFRKEYTFLYNRRDNVSGFQEMVNRGDDFIRQNKDLVGKFCRYRGDCLSSDREVAAFMYALDSLS